MTLYDTLYHFSKDHQQAVFKDVLFLKAGFYCMTLIFTSRLQIVSQSLYTYFQSLAITNLLRRVLTVVRAEVATILLFQFCAMYQNKNFTNNKLYYQTAQKSVALYDLSDLNM